MVGTDEDSLEEEIDFKKMKITSKVVIIVVVIVLTIISMLLGRQLGYTEGYTYVDNWYSSYVERFCMCRDVTPISNQFNTLNSLNTLEFNISNSIE